MCALIVPIVAFLEFSWIDREQPSRTVVFLKCEAYNRSFSSFPLSKTCFISLQANIVVQRKMANITILNYNMCLNPLTSFKPFIGSSCILVKIVALSLTKTSLLNACFNESNLTNTVVHTVNKISYLVMAQHQLDLVSRQRQLDQALRQRQLILVLRQRQLHLVLRQHQLNLVLRQRQLDLVLRQRQLDLMLRQRQLDMVLRQRQLDLVLRQRRLDLVLR